MIIDFEIPKTIKRKISSYSMPIHRKVHICNWKILLRTDLRKSCGMLLLIVCLLWKYFYMEEQLDWPHFRANSHRNPCVQCAFLHTYVCNAFFPFSCFVLRIPLTLICVLVWLHAFTRILVQKKEKACCCIVLLKHWNWMHVFRMF